MSPKDFNSRPITSTSIAGRGETEDHAAFFRTMTHDLRASTRAIAETAHWLSEDLGPMAGDLSPDAPELLDLLGRHARRLDGMIGDISAYAKAGENGPDEHISIEAALAPVLAEFQKKSGLPVISEIKADRLWASEDEFANLLNCLLSNVAKHAEASEIRLRIENGDGQTRVIISDNGVGVPERFVERIFEPFVTLKSRDDCEGSGLGLAIARRICRARGGEILCRPDPQTGGARFVCTFRARKG
ncbi:MAG: HAMP domain-containing sensor histidine kinase [Pseudomonadota bacterium]